MYLACNGAVGFTGDRAHASKGDDGFTRVAGRTGERRQGQPVVSVGGGGAWPGFETTSRATHQRPSAAGVEGAGGPGGHGRASRRGAERSEALASRAAGPDGAWNTSGAASNKLNREFRLRHWCGKRRRVRRARPYRWAATGPGCGARGRWRGLAAVPVGGGGVWPGFEPTRRAKLAARTASGRAGRAAAGDLSGQQSTKAGRPPPTGTPSSPAQKAHPTPGTPAATKHYSNRHRNTTPGIQKTDIRIGCRPVVELGGFEPPTFSLRTRRATNCAIAPRTQTA